MHARAPAGFPAADQGRLWNVGLGKTVEGSDQNRLPRVLSPRPVAAEKRCCPCGDARGGSWSGNVVAAGVIRLPASLKERELALLIMVREDRRDGWWATSK